jgi:hypothetical protein
MGYRLFRGFVYNHLLTRRLDTLIMSRILINFSFGYMRLHNSSIDIGLIDLLYQIKV